MTNDRWRQVDEVFEAALELRGAARDALLERVGADDPELRRAVDRLLALDSEAGRQLSMPAMAAAFVPEAPNSESERVDARIGPYRLCRRIGHGGMGQVFLARRDDDQFEQQVAIKLLSGPGAPSLLRRFRTERQILARFEHPWIARLIDGGVTDDGRLYLVLEYVDGVSIDQYCRNRQLSLGQRIRLFLDVCSAVTYAHQQLIVHRDLKPANILVTAEGTPKLLDFGIAKVLDPGQFPLALAETQLGLRPLTLQYASPEQVLGRSISTATDVYGLGLLLFELITGHRPLPLEGLSSAEAELKICEQDPPSASSVLAQHALVDGLPIRPHQLKGDLDKILAMALAKEPGRRYQSVRHLAEDLERHLDRRPVSARSGGWFYHATRFVRRRSLAVGTVSAIFLILVGFLVTVQIQSRQVARERDEAQAARRHAERVSGYLVDLFSNANPDESRGRPATARELLERGAGEILAQLDDDPELQSTLMLTMAEAHSGLGHHEQAIRLLETARTRRQRFYGPTHPKVAEASVLLGSLWAEWGNDQVLAEALLREALAIRTTTFGEDHLQTLESQLALGDLRILQGRFEDARQLYTRVLERQVELLGAGHLDSVKTLLALASVAGSLGHPREEVQILEAALPLLRQILGDDHPEVALTMHTLGETMFELGNLQESEKYLGKALELRQRLYDPDHPSTAKTRSSLALVYTQQGNPRAVPLAREALAQRRRSLGDDHPQVAHSMTLLGEALYVDGQIDEALATYRQAVALAVRSLPPDHPRPAYPMKRLGSILLELGRPGEAEPLLRRAVELRRRAMPEGAPLLVVAESELERCLRHLGEEGQVERSPRGREEEK